MSLADDIRIAQRNAGEQAVIDNLKRISTPVTEQRALPLATSAELIATSLEKIAEKLSCFHNALCAGLDASITGSSEEEIQRRVLEALKGFPNE